MSGGELSIQHPVIALTVVAAIPVVLYALWADYYHRYIALLESERAEDFDRASELRTVRLSGVFTIAIQALIFLAVQPLRDAYPILSLAIFLVALLAQGQVQFSLEKSLRKVEAAPTENLQHTLRSMGWLFLSLFTYWVTLAVFVAGAYGLARLFKSSPQGAAVAVLIGQFVGIFAGLAMNYALAPVFLRKMVPVREFGDSEGSLKSLFTGCFSRAGLRTPQFFVIEMERFRWNNALIAGFTNGRGFFKAGFFLTRSLIEKLSAEEIEAVACHEVSHSALSHLRNRFVLGAIAVILTTIVAGGLFFVAKTVVPATVFKFAKWWILMLPIGVPWLAIRSQSRTQEFEADAHAVMHLGAKADALAEALKKIDQMNDVSIHVESLPVVGGTHPATEARIQRLRLLNTSESSGPGQSRQAA